MSFSVTLPIRLRPPMRTSPISTAMTMPMIRFTVPRPDTSSAAPKFIRAESIAAVIVLTCVAFPVPKTVSTPSTAYI